MWILFQGFASLKQINQVNLEFIAPMTIANIRNELLQHLNSILELKELVTELHGAAFAVENRILTDTEVISESTTLYILPPVCGG